MGLADLKLDNQMSTSSHNLFSEFFLPATNAAKSYDRATGYFSSALWALAPAAFADFFSRGGTVRLLCSPRLAADERAAVIRSNELKETDFSEIIGQLKELRTSGQDRRSDLLRVLSSLIAVGSVELRFAEVARDSNLFHDKVGVFTDAQLDEMSFVGSANESASAWSGFGNHEAIEIFRGWSSDSDMQRIQGHKMYFEELWTGRRRGVKVTSSRESGEIIFRAAEPEPVEEILREFRARVRTTESLGPLSQGIRLRDYQREALNNWRGNSNRGIISFATGGGKTLTALKAVDDWTKTFGPALILLPSTILLRQWQDEIYSWLPAVQVQTVGAGTPKAEWKKRLYRYTEPGVNSQRVVLATYQSAKTEDFLMTIKSGAHLLVVGDEVHTFGAADTRRISETLVAGATLGLSATPERAGDEEGTQAIFEYFGPIVEPRFTISDALNAGVLCEYDYRFEECPLSPEELEAWEKLSRDLSREIARHKGKMSDKAKLIAIKRARISKGAVGKDFVAGRIIRENFKAGDRWLIYCESVDHLNRVRSAISTAAPDVFVMEYHSKNKKQHADVLRYFTKRGGAILAIKCLDEGVDIPATNKAIVMSSSTNYREYVQRRGRVLRTVDGKSHAEIWDLLTVDDQGTPITKGEIVRAREFAKTAANLSSLYRLESLEAMIPDDIVPEFEDA